MDHCFIFSKYLNESGCFCLKILANGSVDSLPAHRTFKEIKILQKECKTIIIESSSSANLLNVELPWLADRKSRAAIPYALEERLAQPVEELHFSFDRAHYHNGRYLVAVIAKKRLAELTSSLDEQNIGFESITLDWFALEPQQAYATDSDVLINNDDFQGTLSGSLATKYLKQHPELPLFLFEESIAIEHPNTIKVPESSYLKIAQNIIKTPQLNLCQGEMQHETTSDWAKRSYFLAGASCLIWLLSILLVNAIKIHSINKEMTQVDEKTAVIYHQFFPDAKQVISPKFRISQLLSTNTTENQTRFWFLLNEFAKVMKNKAITIEQLRYQNKTLAVTLISTDFEHIEAIEAKLKQAQLKVNQTEASTHDQQVTATLELS
jgi:general secretion pathway protein L